MPERARNGAFAPLAGRRALVTGASRGIGRAVTLALARAGCGLAIAARTDSDLRGVAAAAAKEGGGVCMPVACDVTNPAAVTALADQVCARLGGIDILVNNAGRGRSHSFRDHPDELWADMLAVNLNSAYYVTKACIDGMIERRWGRIINIASTAASTGMRYIAAYTAAKHGLLGLTRALAVEFASAGITVNAVSPGYVDTPMTDATIENIAARTGRSRDEARSALQQSNLQRRLIDPDEVAAAVLFLAQESSAGITGHNLQIDCGGNPI
jgi:NAD(P)-dependent dehydrogenase (short-subunit alcohol dehydrogenase family)